MSGTSAKTKIFQVILLLAMLGVATLFVGGNFKRMSIVASYIPFKAAIALVVACLLFPVLFSILIRWIWIRDARKKAEKRKSGVGDTNAGWLFTADSYAIGLAIALAALAIYSENGVCRFQNETVMVYVEGTDHRTSGQSGTTVLYGHYVSNGKKVPIRYSTSDETSIPRLPSSDGPRGEKPDLRVHIPYYGAEKACHL